MKQELGRQRKPERERERLLKITIKFGLKNRNPLFPELETVCVYVFIRCVVCIVCVCIDVFGKRKE